MMKHSLTRRDFLRGSLMTASAAFLGAPLVRASGGEIEPGDSNLDFLADRMRVMFRSEWTHTPPDRTRMRLADEFCRITVHHVGASVNNHTRREAVAADLAAIQVGHNARNFGDIAYHLAVDYSGRVWECRAMTFEGAHVANANDQNIGIVVIGNFEIQKPSAEQVGSLRQLVEILREYHGISRNSVYGHCDLGASACPGQNLYAHVMGMRAQEERSAYMADATRRPSDDA